MALDSVNGNSGIGAQQSYNSYVGSDDVASSATVGEPAVALAQDALPAATPSGDGFNKSSEPMLPDNVQKSLLLAYAGPTNSDGAGDVVNTTQTTSARNGKTYSTTGAGTQATYKTGSPQRPNISYDNGFLQNSKNAADPKPIATRSPSWDDRVAYAKAQLKADAALTAVNLGVSKSLTPDQFDKYLDLPDGISAYHHFLNGNGADSKFSYDKFVKDDASGKAVLNNAVGDTQRGAEDIYRQMVANDPSLAGRSVTFKITGSQIGVGNDGKFPYPATENWQKAIGAHNIWSSAEVNVKPSAKAGVDPTFTMKYTLHGEDRYNFNPGAKDIATGQPDSDNGRFEVTGLARQYMNYGSLSRNVSWTSGNINSSTSVAGGPR